MKIILLSAFLIQTASSFAVTTRGGSGTEWHYKVIEVPTKESVQVIDMTHQIREFVEECGISDGCVNVMSKHTTTAVTINEYESNLVEDLRRQLLRFAPPLAGYLHDNLEDRPTTPEDAAKVESNWKGTVEEWRAQEPINAQAHLCAMMLGSSEVIPISDGKLALGTWQSLMMVELDGPRQRTLAVQVMGCKAE